MIKLLVALVLLAGNAFFVAAEFSLIASRRTNVEPLAATSRRARAALRAMGQIPLMLSGAQLGVTICSLGLGALAEPALAHLLEHPFHAVGLPERALHPVAFTLALVIVVFLHTVLGEMVPKNLTLAGPETAVLWLGPPMLAFCIATKPILVMMKWLAKMILRVWSIEAQEAVKTVYTAEELANLVTQASTEGLLDPAEQTRIQGALALHSRTARDAMRPWREVATISVDAQTAELEALAARTGRSRFPVVRRLPGSGGRPILKVEGFVHVKDALGHSAEGGRLPADMLRRLKAVPADRPLADLLLSMRRQGEHIVVVADGPTPLGLLTLHDVLAMIQKLPT